MITSTSVYQHNHKPNVLSIQPRGQHVLMSHFISLYKNYIVLFIIASFTASVISFKLVEIGMLDNYSYIPNHKERI